jgi:hypothetical protein
MFGSAIVDILLAAIFAFLAISLAASAFTEAISSLLKLWQSTLHAGVQALLNDYKVGGLADQLYKHALVNPLLSDKETSSKPAYIDPEHFATALVDVLKRQLTTDPVGPVVNPGAPAVDPMATALSDIPDPALKQALQALYESADKDMTRFKVAVGAWFDSAMDRLAGWYKRETQLISFFVAFISAALLNADALRVTSLVSQRPSLANGVSAMARQTDPVALDFWFDALQRIASIRGTGNAIGSLASGSK